MRISGENLVLVVDELMRDNPHALAAWVCARRAILEDRDLTLEEADSYCRNLENATVWMESGRPEDDLIVNLAEVDAI